MVISQVLYMMKMLQGAPYSFEYPIHVAIKNTDKALALFIIENKVVYLGKNSSGSNSLQLAAVSKFHKKKNEISNSGECNFAKNFMSNFSGKRYA